MIIVDIIIAKRVFFAKHLNKSYDKHEAQIQALKELKEISNKNDIVMILKNLAVTTKLCYSVF